MDTTKLEYIDITENVVMTALYPYETDHVIRLHESATMSCIALPDELCFVDCGAITANARQFRTDMEVRFDRPTTHLFLTHDHWHSNYGMAAFKDVNIVMSSPGTSYYRRNLKDGVYSRWKQVLINRIPDDEKLRNALLNASLFIPNISVSNQKVFGAEPHHVLFKVVGGHTKPSSIVYIPSEKTLFTGGNLNSCYANLLWSFDCIDTYIEWEQMDIEHVVPGHGFAVDKTYISLMRKYFEELLAKLRELKKQGVTKGQVLKFKDFPEYPGKKQKSWIEGSPYHTENIRKLVKYWYGQVLKEKADEEDLMFIN